MPSLFLSHSSKDKAFARRLAEELTRAGVKVWIDEAELRVGDSLVQRISQAVSDSDYLAVVLSQNSVQSEWVRHELKIAMAKELRERRITVLPILKERCEVPAFLVDKLYADFTHPSKFAASVDRLLAAMHALPPARDFSAPAPSTPPTPPKRLPTPEPGRPAPPRPAGPCDGASTALQVFEDLAIVGVDRARTYKPDSEKLLYNIFLSLSGAPPQEWVEMFDAERQFPRHTMWRRAWVEDRYIVVHCVPEELEQYHLEDLRQDVKECNRKYRQYLYRQSNERTREEQAEQQARTALDDALDKLTF